MTNPIEQAHQALLARLGQIVPANGYCTDAGTRIREGWLQDILAQDDVTFPLIAVQPAVYLPGADGPGADLWRIGRRVVGAVDPGAGDDYRQLLDELFFDLAACLQVQPGMPNPWGQFGPRRVSIEPSQLFAPAEGLRAGTVLFPIQLHVVIRGKDT
ncbi:MULTISPECIES: hypothetical protein [unclassified Pseudomonas]|uniref:hypothetical protein n=1 Tax=unclassified Pseudomonas TaxID=196821 RepID=UPI002449BF17|nr:MULTISPECIES: hypothetical protein [unclassified Pseudomonas]MDG9928532.1 hypothetical protein [Pseudomonas sp. GD04042]MDH0482702.1 hypothetical protein [Pseudomonas sp. GD04015]MDH0604596.1 hypothetical protein [Pseudomonas sp. GD03869]